jgi:hypothetical protein
VTAEQHTNIIDEAQSGCLCAGGQQDYLAAVCIEPDGGTHLILALLDDTGAVDPKPRYDPTCKSVKHEQTGRLPVAVRDRIWGDALRCGRPTWSGRPCRHRVKEPGDTCGEHRDARTPAKPEQQELSL